MRHVYVHTLLRNALSGNLKISMHLALWLGGNFLMKFVLDDTEICWKSSNDSSSLSHIPACNFYNSSCLVLQVKDLFIYNVND